MHKQRKRDQGAVTLQSLSESNQIMSSVYMPKQALSSQVFEWLGLALVVLVPLLFIA